MNKADRYKLGNLTAHTIEYAKTKYIILNNGCWQWGGRYGLLGYGFIGKDNLVAHRITWMIANNSDWPTGLEASHQCHNRGCVNPAHIVPTTHIKNLALTKDRSSNLKRVTTPVGLFNSVTAAATALNVSRTTLYKRLKTDQKNYYYI